MPSLPPTTALAPRRLRLDQQPFRPPAHWSAADTALFHQVCALTTAHLAEPDFGPAPLAAAMALSLRTLYRRLRELTGYSLAGFIRERRLLWARHLLRTGARATVGEVARAVGFVNGAHFGQAYVRRFGYPPGQDRGPDPAA